MSDYISREDVLALTDDFELTLPDDEIFFSYIPVVAVEKLPAADVRPVVRGRDICDTVNGHCEFKCSVCGVELSSVYGGNNDFGLDGGYFNFCPNCGAMMTEHCFNTAGEPPQQV